MRRRKKPKVLVVSTAAGDKSISRLAMALAITSDENKAPNTYDLEQRARRMLSWLARIS